MKYCPGCRMMVGGNFGQCPLCQNDLQGDGEENIFPFSIKLNKQSFIYKLQLFISLAALIICLALDFLIGAGEEKHWSLLVFVWIAGSQICIRGLIKKHSTVSRIVSYISVGGAVLLAYTFWFLSMTEVYFNFVLPSMCCFSLIIHFFLSMLDKARNAMVYFLVNILVVVVIEIALSAYLREVPILWTICLMAGGVTLAGIVIFKGRRVLTEIQKRLNF
ncbi:MAG: DUF6320 domain-containing protein [Lachnospiraceae bacterium]|nr:DUF6320 domain-containing protein [Lachnospiraceae bacterium]